MEADGFYNFYFSICALNNNENEIFRIKGLILNRFYPARNSLGPAHLIYC